MTKYSSARHLSLLHDLDDEATRQTSEFSGVVLAFAPEHRNRTYWRSMRMWLEEEFSDEP